MKSVQHLMAGVYAGTALLFCAAAGAGDMGAARDIENALHLKPDRENGREVYLQCVSCHTPQGWGRDDGSYPQIAGQLYSVIIKQMADIRARKRDTPTMLPFTMLENLSVQDVADVAFYVSRLPMAPISLTGHGTDLVRGKQIYQDRCTECHGDKGQGNGEKRVPLIQSQNYHYLKRQFEWIRNGKRRNGDEKMVRQVMDLKPREVAAVLDYVSRLRPQENKLASPDWQNSDFPQFASINVEYSSSVCKLND